MGGFARSGTGQQAGARDPREVMGLEEKKTEMPKPLFAYDETRTGTCAPLQFAAIPCNGCRLSGSRQVETALKGPELGLFL